MFNWKGGFSWSGVCSFAQNGGITHGVVIIIFIRKNGSANYLVFGVWLCAVPFRNVDAITSNSRESKGQKRQRIGQGSEDSCNDFANIGFFAPDYWHLLHRCIFLGIIAGFYAGSSVGNNRTPLFSFWPNRRSVFLTANFCETMPRYL